MIAWWWLLVVLLGVWVPLITVAALTDGEVRTAVQIVAYAAASLPLLPIVWVLSRLDVGAVPLHAKTLEQFARMRSADRTHPAWVFFVWKRGVIILRKWEMGSDRIKVGLNPQWRSGRSDPIAVIQTSGLPDGYTPPSASLTPPTPQGKDPDDNPSA